jgi:hypothetical protein
VKPLILYHGNCYDGFGAAWAAWKKFSDKAEYRPMFYGMEPPTDWWDRDCYVLDFSFPAKVIGDRQLDQSYVLNVTDFKIIDHHKTAEAELREYPGCTIFDMNKSGAVLAWEFFQPSVKVPKLSEYLQDRDLWRLQMLNAREIDCWIKSHPFEFPEFEAMEVEVEFEFQRCVAQGRGALRYQTAMVKVMCDNAWTQNIGGYNVPVTNATVFFSEIGEELCKRNPDAPFAAYYLDRKDGVRQYGLRSRGEFDCSEVAKKLGGGGHKNAAGFVAAVMRAPIV